MFVQLLCLTMSIDPSDVFPGVTFTEIRGNRYLSTGGISYTNQINYWIDECQFYRLKSRANMNNPVRIIRTTKTNICTFMSRCSFYDNSCLGYGGSVFIGTNAGRIALINVCGQQSQSGKQGMFVNLNANVDSPNLINVTNCAMLSCSGLTGDYDVDSTIAVTNGLGYVNYVNFSNNKAIYAAAISYVIAKMADITFSYHNVVNNTQVGPYGLYKRDRDATGSYITMIWTKLNVVGNKYTGSDIKCIFSFYHQPSLDTLGRITNISYSNVVGNDATYLCYSNIPASIFNLINCYVDNTNYYSCTMNQYNSLLSETEIIDASLYYTDNCIYFDATPVNTPEYTPAITPKLTPANTPSSTPGATPSETPSQTPLITPSITPSQTPSTTPSQTPSITPSQTPSITPLITSSTTPSITPLITPLITPSITSSTTPSQTPSITPSETPSTTPSQTPSITPLITPSITQSQTPSETPSTTPSSTTQEKNLQVASQNSVSATSATTKENQTNDISVLKKSKIWIIIFGGVLALLSVFFIIFLIIYYRNKDDDESQASEESEGSGETVSISDRFSSYSYNNYPSLNFMNEVPMPEYHEEHDSMDEKSI